MRINELASFSDQTIQSILDSLSGGARSVIEAKINHIRDVENMIYQLDSDSESEVDEYLFSSSSETPHEPVYSNPNIGALCHGNTSAIGDTPLTSGDWSYAMSCYWYADPDEVVRELIHRDLLPPNCNTHDIGALKEETIATLYKANRLTPQQALACALSNGYDLFAQDLLRAGCTIDAHWDIGCVSPDTYDLLYITQEGERDADQDAQLALACNNAPLLSHLISRFNIDLTSLRHAINIYTSIDCVAMLW